jgi:hypothetical protein
LEIPQLIHYFMMLEGLLADLGVKMTPKMVLLKIPER